MKERPILFSGPMVRALLAGTKTQTRRVMKSQPFESEYEEDWFSWWAGGREYAGMREAAMREFIAKDFCPYGQIGDRLWVRETWRVSHVYDGTSPANIPKGTDLRYDADGAETLCGAYDWSKKARPSIYMPRWASRITLEVTRVRVERLQDISEEDARAEGVESFDNGFGIGWRDYQPRIDSCYHTARGSYKSLWKSINGPGSWDLNPWVWVVEFKRAD